jgi:predicted nucleotidyltransferase
MLDSPWSVTVRLTLDELRRQRAPILTVASRWGAHRLRVFGSVARGAALESSDLDLVASFDPDRSLLDMGGLKADLEDLLGCPVDVLSDAGLRGEFRATVLREAVEL